MSINDYYSSLSICSQSFLNQSNFDSCKMKNSLCHQSHVVIGENIEDSYQKFHQASKIVLCRSNRLIFDHHIFLPNQQNLAQISLLKRRYYVSRFLHLIGTCARKYVISRCHHNIYLTFTSLSYR